MFCANHPTNPLWANPDEQIGRNAEETLPGDAGKEFKRILQAGQFLNGNQESTLALPSDFSAGSCQVSLISLTDGSAIARFSLSAPIASPLSSKIVPQLKAEDDMEQIRQLARAAEQASEAKSRFVANMSHEIRTPLNGITGILEMLAETTLDEEQREFTEIMRSSADALLLIINDILDFSKMEAGKLDLEYIDFDFRTCVESAAEMLSFKAMGKGIELAVLMQPDLPKRVNGDPGRLRQILLNLLSNALKFTHDGEVIVHCALEETREDAYVIRIDVSDTGIGIPEQIVESLFRPFTQEASSTTRHYGGTGLGLSICKQLVGPMG
ncbi:MAG: ATP-binding protein, partial [Candidatus Hydrogenedentes bacterium]|nr:ATP-binding protein [Candidatus Hydrogenedentota bacterium]